MALHAIDNLCKLSNTGGKITLTSDKRELPLAIEELQSADARKLACQIAARRGLADPRVNDMAVRPYPVDLQGEVVVDQTKQAIASYRVDIQIVPKVA